MRKVWQIAAREFTATVFTKAFLFGLLFLPLMIGIGFVVMRAVDDDDYRAAGSIAIADPSGRVAVEARQILGDDPGAAGLAGGREAPAGDEARAAAVIAALARGPDFTIVQLPVDADLEAEKPRLLRPAAAGGLLAIVDMHPDAVEAASDEAEFGSYDLYTAPDIDQRELDALRSMLREVIVNLRIEAYGFERRTIERLTRVARGESITVTESDERESVGGLNILLPMSFVFLLFLAILGGGQHLMTSTIEEKSSRVVEVLLSAVSPMELMAGKLVGHISVSLVAMSVYLVAGLLALANFDLLGLLDTTLILYLFVFFFIAFFTIGSIMLAIGSAVNELREAQSLMLPVTLTLMLPVLLWLPITRDPSSGLSLAVSFVPPVNTLGMLLRLASTEPPPAWQVWLTIAIGLFGVYAALWCAARVFRIGILMTGKPPNLRTLWRWMRAA